MWIILKCILISWCWLFVVDWLLELVVILLVEEELAGAWLLLGWEGVCILLLSTVGVDGVLGVWFSLLSTVVWLLLVVSVVLSSISSFINSLFSSSYSISLVVSTLTLLLDSISFVFCSLVLGLVSLVTGCCSTLLVDCIWLLLVVISSFFIVELVLSFIWSLLVLLSLVVIFINWCSWSFL